MCVEVRFAGRDEKSTVLDADEDCMEAEPEGSDECKTGEPGEGGICSGIRNVTRDWTGEGTPASPGAGGGSDCITSLASVSSGDGDWAE